MTSAPPSLTQHPSLQTYVTLLKKWQPRINLIGPKTLRDIWVRHVQDSAQLLDHLPPILQEQTGQNQPSNQARRLVDFGSGAGFPGLVLAILRPDLDVHLVESDQRKGAFLREVARETGAKITLHSQRIEKLKPLDAHIITARALAPLDKLMSYAQPHRAENGFYIFLKGQNVDAELTEATKCWNFDLETHVSVTDQAARILVLRNPGPRPV
ncbi:MAG: 16S rRNA (guanine(527)-N(7))-methyltransferase RsmG [Pseudomonadota bacterium]